MRCKNCGWENPDTETRCAKCNSTLSNSLSNLKQTERQAPTMQSESLNLKSTVREVQNNNGSPINSIPQENKPKQCHKCGYPLAENMDECPMCGSYQNKKEEVTPKQVNISLKTIIKNSKSKILGVRKAKKNLLLPYSTSKFLLLSHSILSHLFIPIIHITPITKYKRQHLFLRCCLVCLILLVVIKHHISITCILINSNRHFSSLGIF